MGSTRLSATTTTAPLAATLPTQVVKKLAAGASGTQRWQLVYGERLLCVRHRDSESTGARLVTVELAVDRWPARPPGDQQVFARIGRDDADVRARDKAAGASFDWGLRLWHMPARTARRLGLARRIVQVGEASVDGSGKELPDMDKNCQRPNRRVLSI